MKKVIYVALALFVLASCSESVLDNDLKTDNYEVENDKTKLVRPGNSGN